MILLRLRPTVVVLGTSVPGVVVFHHFFGTFFKETRKEVEDMPSGRDDTQNSEAQLSRRYSPPLCYSKTTKRSARDFFFVFCLVVSNSCFTYTEKKTTKFFNGLQDVRSPQRRETDKEWVETRRTISRVLQNNHVLVKPKFPKSRVQYQALHKTSYTNIPSPRSHH